MEFSRSDLVAAEVQRRLAGRHALLLTDFDGTLAELAPTPGEAVMDDDVRAHIDVLSALESVTVGVVSGRRLFDVRSRVGPAAKFVAGLHGLEIMGPAEAYVHPSLETIAPVIRDLCRTAARELAWCQGLLLEDKTFSLTCHVRLARTEDAARALDAFAALAEPQIERGVLRLLPGAKAYELLPAADWHKGRAVEWIRARVAPQQSQPVSVVYLGDDRTDEDAFASLNPDDIGIAIGSRPHSHLVQFRLAGPASSGRFFGHLAALRLGS
jgi:trehalose-phosphatase